MNALSLAQRSRDAVLVGWLPPDAGLSHLIAQGPDAARFLHSQLTNDVEGLEPGTGNLQARVERTGHLLAVASAHRDPRADHRYHFVGSTHDVQALHEALDAFLFADDLALARAPTAWVTAQGPKAAAVLDAVFGPLGFEPWSTLPEHAIRPLKRARAAAGLTIPPESYALRRSLGGDEGFLLAVPNAATAEAIASALGRAAQGAGGATATGDALLNALDTLRIEAGIPRVDVDCVAKRRLLPETGVEQQAVSYAKGCYLGQEVIARVRTYGSVPTLLRALVLPGEPNAALASLPPIGAELRLAEGNKRVGHAASRAVAPTLGKAVLLAFLDRAHRTPGTTLRFEGESGPWEATVALLPLYAAPDAASKVALLYDRAIRTFADGDEPAALTLLEQALRLDPSHADAAEAIGVILGKSGRYHEAIDVFRRLEEVAPNEPMVNTNLSLYYMKLGDKQTAEDEAAKATLKNMSKARGRGGNQVDADLEASKRKDAARKRKMFSQVLEFDPDDPIALFGMGKALLTLDEPAEAAGLLARAVTVDKNNSAVYPLHGRALEALGDHDAAIEVYRQGVEVASRKGDLMPLKEMEHRLLLLGAKRSA